MCGLVKYTPDEDTAYIFSRARATANQTVVLRNTLKLLTNLASSVNVFCHLGYRNGLEFKLLELEWAALMQVLKAIKDEDTTSTTFHMILFENGYFPVNQGTFRNVARYNDLVRSFCYHILQLAPVIIWSLGQQRLTSFFEICLPGQPYKLVFKHSFYTSCGNSYSSQACNIINRSRKNYSAAPFVDTYLVLIPPPPYIKVGASMKENMEIFLKLFLSLWDSQPLSSKWDSQSSTTKWNSQPYLRNGIPNLHL